MTDEEFLLASPIVYGFSLSDKIWCKYWIAILRLSSSHLSLVEFNIEHIHDIVWNEEAFAGLVLAADRQNLLRLLVDAHNKGVGFDDFV